MKLIFTFTSSSNEFKLFKCNINKWPDLRRDIVENVKMAVQINGKTKRRNLSQKRPNSRRNRSVN